MDWNLWYRGTKAVDFRSIPGMAGVSAGLLKRYRLMVQPFFFCASNHSPVCYVGVHVPIA